MSRGEQLFVRGMMSENSDNDMWNDTALIKAYDKAMRSYKPVDIAQRIAMATNGQPAEPAKPRSWRVGAPCRATYSEDGLDYEAFILELVDQEECVVRFIGYDEDAIVKLKDLKPSLGNAARSQQIHNITTEPSWKEIKAAFEVDGEGAAGARPASGEGARCKQEAMECEQDDMRSVDTGVSTDKLSRKTKKKTAKKNRKYKAKKRKNSNPLMDVFTDLPKIPTSFNVGLESHLGILGGDSVSMPPPPPILPPTDDMDEEEQEALNNLLTAWYMSGYYAGLYQSRLKKRLRNP